MSLQTFIGWFVWTEVLVRDEVVVVVAAHQRVVALHLIVPRHREVPRHVHPDCVLVRLLPDLSKRF